MPHTIIVHDLYTSLQTDLLYADTPGTGSRYPLLGSVPMGSWVNVVNAEPTRSGGEKMNLFMLNVYLGRSLQEARQSTKLA